MKRQYVNELADGVRVDSEFVISSKQMRTTRGGEPYLALELADRTGRMPGVWFRAASGGATVPVGSVASVQGCVTTYRGVKRVTVESLGCAGEFEQSDMLPGGLSDNAQIVQEFRTVAAGVRSPELRRVLTAVFADEVFFSRFTQCPGAQSHHHAYIGGLVEHSLAVARICRSLSLEYPQVDSDLLVTAALLHDIGKVDELSWGTSIEYTDQGRLLGHVVLGQQRLRDATSRLRKPVSSHVLMRLSHAMLSHHGELEWGSPKRPSTLEALLLHHADNLDAKAAGFVDLVSGAGAVQERWTDSYNLFRRPLFVPVSAEDDRPAPIAEDGQYMRTSA
jgi:3'-5' exoribonuclease